MKKPPLPKWCMVVRESVSTYEREVLRDSTKVATSEAVARLLRERLGTLVNETMVVLVLDGQNHIMAMSEISRGGLHGCSVMPRDCFRLACAIGGSGIILAHNHPSGNPTPSGEDVTFTRAIAKAGEVIGIPLVDHVVIAGTQHASMCDLGIL